MNKSPDKDKGNEVPPKEMGTGCEIEGLSASGLMKAALGEDRGEESLSEGGRDSSGAYNFFGDYELIEPVGSGGMGIVFRARQVSLDRRVAVKLITMGGFADEQSKRRFRREAENAAKLQHPNIVKVYEVGEDNGQPFYSMEYIEGPTLALMIKHGALPWRKACEYMVILAKAVHFAHEQGVLHRDLKPQNVMVDPFDNPRITDFGLSYEMDSERTMTLTGQMLGTPDYIPLEQALGKREEVGERSEIYSLGAILYACLTTRPPYHGETVAEVIDQQRNEALTAPREWNPSIPRDLNTVCLKCLEKNPQNRYATAKELAEELQRVLDDRPILAKEVSQVQRGWRWCRRNPYASLTILLLVVTAAVSLYAYVVSSAALRTAETKRVEAEYESYVAKLALAHAKVQDGSFEQAREQLLSTPKRYRNWEWGRLYAMSDPDVRTLTGHSLPITSAAFSPRTSWLVTGGGDGKVLLWRLKDGKVLKVFEHEGVVRTVAYSPDGKRVATGGEDPEIRIWDVNTGDLVKGLETEGVETKVVAYSPDGKYLVSGGDDGMVRLWNAKKFLYPEILYRGLDDVMALSFSPDSRLLAVGKNDGTCIILDVGRGKKVRNFSFDGTSIPVVRFSPDGEMLGIGTWGSEAHVVGVKDGKVLTTVRHNGPVTSLAFSPHGRWVLTGGLDNTVRITDIRSGRLRYTYKPHDSLISFVGMTEDGRSLVTASYDTTVKVFPINPSNKTIPLSGHKSVIREVRFFSDGKKVATGSGDRRVIVWDARTGQQLNEFKGNGGVESFDVSKDDKWMVAGYGNGEVWIWDVNLGKVRRKYLEHRGPVYSVRFSKNGRQVLSTAQDGSTRLWEWEGEGSGIVLRQVSPDSEEIASQVEFSPDGSWIALGNWDGTIVLLRSKGGEEVMHYEEKARIRSLAFSPDGKMLFAGSDDNTVKIFALSQKEKIGTLQGHSQAVLSVYVFPDGKRVATASGDGTTKIWDVETRRELLTLRGATKGMQGLAYSPVLKTLVTGDWNNSGTVWVADDWSKSKEEIAQDRSRSDRIRSISAQIHSMISYQSVFSPMGTKGVPGASALVFFNDRGASVLPPAFDLTLHNDFSEVLHGSVVLRSDEDGIWPFLENVIKISIPPQKSQTISIPLPNTLTPQEVENSKSQPSAVWNLSLGEVPIWTELSMPVRVDDWPYEDEVDRLRSALRLRPGTDCIPGKGRKVRIELTRRNPLSNPIRESFTWKLPEKGLWTVSPKHKVVNLEPNQIEKVDFTVVFGGGEENLHPLPRLKSVVKMGKYVMLEQEWDLPVNFSAYFSEYQPKAEVQRVEIPPKIDGKLDEKVWSRSGGISRLFSRDGSGLPKYETEAKLLYDRECLYLGLRMKEPYPNQVVSLTSKPDRYVDRQDSVGLFVKHPAHEEYFQFVFGTGKGAGQAPQIYDARGENRSWNGNFRVIAGREAKAWVLEVAIPWSTLEIDESMVAEGELNFQLVRTRAQNPYEKSVWAPQMRDLRIPSKWGILEFESGTRGEDGGTADRE